MNRRELMLLLGATMTAARPLRAQQKAMPVIGSGVAFAYCYGYIQALIDALALPTGAALASIADLRCAEHNVRNRASGHAILGSALRVSAFMAHTQVCPIFRGDRALNRHLDIGAHLAESSRNSPAGFARATPASRLRRAVPIRHCQMVIQRKDR
jgi:hypothetical protein